MSHFNNFENYWTLGIVPSWILPDTGTEFFKTHKNYDCPRKKKLRWAGFL